MLSHTVPRRRLLVPHRLRLFALRRRLLLPFAPAATVPLHARLFALQKFRTLAHCKDFFAGLFRPLFRSEIGVI